MWTGEAQGWVPRTGEGGNSKGCGGGTEGTMEGQEEERGGHGQGTRDRTLPTPPCSPSCRDGRLLGRVQQAAQAANRLLPQGASVFVQLLQAGAELTDHSWLVVFGPGEPPALHGVPPTAWTFSGRGSEGEQARQRRPARRRRHDTAGP